MTTDTTDASWADAWLPEIPDASSELLGDADDDDVYPHHGPIRYGPTFVAGVAGGAGTTTVACLIGAELAGMVPAMLLDATIDGDLADRVGQDEGSWQQWFRNGSAVPDDLIARPLAPAWRRGGEAEAQSPFPYVLETIADQGAAAIVDVGTGLSSRLLREVWPTVGAAVVVLRDDPVHANRLARLLSRLRNIDPTLPSRTVVAITHSRPTSQVVQRLSTSLADKTAGVVPIPADEHLATGHPLQPSRLRAAAVSFGRNLILRPANESEALS